MAELLRDHTTLRLGGPAGRWVEATTEQELVDAVSGADEAGEPLLLVAGGSNLVVADEGFAGTVVHVATTGVAADHEGDDPTCGGVLVTVAAGESWDDLVATAVAARVDRPRGALRHPRLGRRHADPERRRLRPGGLRRPSRRCGSGTAPCGACARSPTPTAVSPTGTAGSRPTPPATWSSTSPSSSTQGSLGAPVRYAELARRLGVAEGERAPLADVRQAVLDLRRGKGMVLDADDHDTWSAGSFFTNPVVDPDAVPEGAPAWPQPDGRVKTSAAWLIDHAGFARGTAPARPASRPSTPSPSPTGAGHDLRPARPRPRGTRRRRAGVRHPPRQRAGARRLRALTDSSERKAPVVSARWG